MLSVVNNGKQIPLNFDDYYIQEVYGGKDAAGFTLPLEHPDYQYIFEETPLIDTETGQRYLIKAIDEGQTTVNIKAELDLDELSKDMFLNYTNGSDTVLGTISDILPSGWTVQDHAYFSQRRTVELEAATPLDIIDACADTYSVVFQFNNAERIVHIYNPDSEEISGVFLTDELNLKSVNFKGKSSGFATRLYARGKDNLTFSGINNGKDYVEDFSYSDKVISVYWKDERYTVAENLLADAKKRLKSMAVPQQSYTCGVMDLARAREQQAGENDNIYAFLDFVLYQNVVLLDRRRKRRIIHTVAGIKRYPKYPEKNEVTLSTVAPSIQNSVKSIQTQIEKPTSAFNQIRQAAIDAATELITGLLGGHYIETTDPETGKPNGWAIMDTDNTETAVNVWRMTAGGFGHSHNGFNGPYDDIAITMDGKINASMILVGTLIADIIKSGTLSSTNGKCTINLDTGNCDLTGTYTSEWFFADGKSGKIRINPNGITFYYDEKHRGSFYVTTNDETAIKSGNYLLHYPNYSGTGDDSAFFAWMSSDKKRYVASDEFILKDEAFAWISSNDRSVLEADELQIKGDNIFINEQAATWKTVTIDGQTITYLGR